MSDLESEYQRGRRLRDAGRLEEALAVFDALVREFPDAAAPRAARGMARCHLEHFDAGVADLRAAIAMAPRDADFHSDLGLVLHVLERGEEAGAELRRALMIDPGHPEALCNLSLVLGARGDFAGAEIAARKALAARPGLHAARNNLAYALLVQGRFSDAWPLHDHRTDPRENRRDASLAANAVPHASRLPDPGAPIVLHGEQGLGDTLFFLRFAPLLAARGHRLAFWGDARLRPVLARAALFEHFIAPESAPAADLAVVWVGDLPGLLGANDAALLPPALPVAGDPERRAALAAYLTRFGPAPYVGLTWRAGLARQGRRVLAQEVPAADLARSLAGLDATLISLQRAPRPGEIAVLAQALGRPIHDGASLNDRLEDALAAMELLDEYVAVSNTNIHLRGGAGRSARVLVPWPPEWRWLCDVQRSPWFREMPLYRQDARGDWSAALERLGNDLRGARGQRG
jgi:Flp pilus assembly protein TadD